MPLHLLPAQLTDIPTLSALAGASFENDRHTILKSTVGSYNHAEGMKGALEMWIGIHTGPHAHSDGDEGKQRRCEVWKAVLEEEGRSEGEIVGWVAWGFRGFESTTTPTEAGAEPPTAQPDDGDEEQAQTQSRADEDAADNPLTSSIAKLEKLTDDDMDHTISTLLMPPGTQCLYILSICVSPLHQSRGVGSALISYGTRRADAAGVSAWVHSSEAGAGAFEKLGFREVRRLEVDLDEYCDGVGVPEGMERRGEGMGWGRYVFRYLVRRPGGG